LNGRAWRQIVDFPGEFLHILNRDVDFSNNEVLPQLHLVQVIVDKSLFPDIGAPVVNVVDALDFI
jgi:hypothetical protein